LKKLFYIFIKLVIYCQIDPKRLRTSFLTL
jgi:hypothetical protein